jgi:NAD(P)-dependent dehydrogenase (short-subunit alcohol dehydrogenase family)
VGSLSNHHALVTGAGRGIGLAVARALAQRGATLTLIARSVDQLEDARKQCRELGSPLVKSASVNLTDRRALENVARGGAAQADILVNNAGTAPSAPIERSTDELWDGTFALNAFAPFSLCRAALPAMGAGGWGRIVNVASTAALEGYAYTAAYCASKHALLGLTRALTMEAMRRWPEADISINAVCPGFVDTEILREAADRIAAQTGVDIEEARATLAAMNPDGRLLSPEDVAERVVALIEEQPGATRGAAVEFA